MDRFPSEENLQAGFEQEYCHRVMGQNIFTPTFSAALPRHPKIARALRQLLRLGVIEVILDGPPVTLKVMQFGETGFTLNPHLTDRNDEPASMVVLAPTLEKEPLWVVTYTIAHEHAHVLTEEAAQELLNAPCGNCHQDECPNDCRCLDMDEATQCQTCREIVSTCSLP